MKVRFEAKVTRGFSLSPRRFCDSLSPLASRLAVDLFREEKSRKTSGTRVLYHTLIDLSAFDALRQALPSLVVYVFVLNERHNPERLLHVRNDFVISGS